MKTFITIIFFVVPLNLALGQKSVSFIEADTSTYRAYLNSDWNRIIEVGNMALESGVDYYYLRLRMGYAFFMKSRYGLAIPHYRKALEFSNNDAIALEFLYYCYRYTARDNDAEKLTTKFTPALKTYLKKENTRRITNLGFYTTFGTGAVSSLKEDINLSAPTLYEGRQILPNSFTNFNFQLSHSISKSIILRHSANLLYKDEYAFAVVNSIPYISESQVIRQFNYHIGADITPITGFTLTPVFSYINYRIPVFYEYGTGSGKNRNVFTYNTHKETAFGIKGGIRSGIVKVSLAGSHSNLNLSFQNTVAISLNVFPMSNLNLYLTASGYLHSQKQNDSGIQQFIQSYLVGFRPIKQLWIEGGATIGGFSNFYDPFSELIYNSLELYNSLGNVNLIFPYYKSGISLFASYRYYSSESMFVPVEDVFETENHKTIKYQSYTIGLSWKL